MHNLFYIIKGETAITGENVKSTTRLTFNDPFNFTHFLVQLIFNVKDRVVTSQLSSRAINVLMTRE